jgi:hypothetical protein
MRLITSRIVLCVVSASAVLSLSAPVGSQQEDLNARLPVVVTAGVPFYPRGLRVGYFQGDVRILARTNGVAVADVDVESGQPMLAQAARENLATWRFLEHRPTSFRVTFHYKLLPAAKCYMDSGTVVLRMPTEVEVTASSVMTCDPPAGPRK